jgi:hypothetical protein
MAFQDYLGLTIFVGFGLWWARFPTSVINFYSWFHGARARVPNAEALSS